MRPVSAAFQQIVRGSHRMSARARVCAPGQTGVNPTGTEVPILSGDVQLDANADVRSTVDLTTDGSAMWPTSPSGLLTPYGNELFVERGVVYGDGAVEWVSLGYHRLYAVEQDDVPNGPIRLAGRDRMSAIIDGELLAVRQFTAGTTISAVFNSLVLEVYPEAVIEYDFNAAATTLTGSHVAEEDRYGFLLDLVQSLGKIMYFDHQGKLQIRSAPNPTVPVLDVNHGANGVLVAMSRALDREGVYNAVVAIGETPGATAVPRAVAYDLNPSSPTWWNGPFGRVPRFYSSPFIASDAQAFGAAEAMLRRAIGLPYNVDFTAVPNPALEPLDPVRVTYANDAPAEIHVIETMTVPLVSDAPLTAGTREQTTVTIGANP